MPFELKFCYWKWRHFFVPGDNSWLSHVDNHVHFSCNIWVILNWFEVILVLYPMILGRVSIKWTPWLRCKPLWAPCDQWRGPGHKIAALLSVVAWPEWQNSSRKGGWWMQLTRSHLVVYSPLLELSWRRCCRSQHTLSSCLWNYWHAQPSPESNLGEKCYRCKLAAHVPSGADGVAQSIKYYLAFEKYTGSSKMKVDDCDCCSAPVNLHCTCGSVPVMSIRPSRKRRALTQGAQTGFYNDEVFLPISLYKMSTGVSCRYQEGITAVSPKYCEDIIRKVHVVHSPRLVV